MTQRAPGLRGFLESARQRVARGAYAAEGPALAPNGSLADALRVHPTPVIAELKPRAPGAGDLLRRPAAEMAAAYRAGGAAALSALADADHFGGSPELVRIAHGTGLPVLFKDFVVDAAQVRCAAHCGASAILLVERAFAGRPGAREALVAAARAAGLEVVLEVFDAADWASARGSQADLIGVNARDLGTLAVDPAAARALVAAVARERTVIALSGIHCRADYREARAAGACAALVGTALLRSRDPVLTLRGLQRPLAKVCGLRSEEDVLAAAASGADLAGFVVGSPGSPRDLAPADARRLAAQARGRGLRTVLVTRAADLADVAAWCGLVKPDLLQLHGPPPPPAWARNLASAGIGLMQAFDADASGAKADEADDEAGAAPSADAVLADSGPEGGSGRPHDWTATRRLFARTPGRLSLVAGGLDASNAAQAVAATGAWGADASSRLESEPGRKDPRRIALFVQAVRGA